MVDNRFFTTNGPFTLQEIAELSGADIHNAADGQQLIQAVGPLETADKDTVSFFSNHKYKTALAQSKAGVCVLHADDITLAPRHMVLLVAGNPYQAYAKIAQAFYPEEVSKTGVSELASIDPAANIGSNVTIEAGVVIAAGVSIGDGCHIGANTVIGKGVTIGESCRIGSNVTLSHAVLGNNIIIYPGAKIGQDGFGYAFENGKHFKVPQLGRVVIGDEVDIGANTTIDRGSGHDTVIGEGCKIDNLVQIGHNVQLGKGCVIVAMAGIAGSTVLGDYVVVGGNAGIAGHITIGACANIAAKSGVTRDISSGKTVAGYPALPIMQWRRQSALLKRLIKSGKAS